MGTTRVRAANAIPYGGVCVFHCTVPGTVALTYDDGPSEFSNNLLDLFYQYNGNATFFINGNNKGRGMIDDPSTGWPTITKRMADQGHQVASHTWSHQSLDTISGAQRQAQIVYNEVAFGNILGRYPTYIWPPYSQCASECQALLADLGYHIINFDVDIDDAIGHPDLQTSINDFSGNFTTKSNPSSDNMLVIGHETSSDTVNKITEIILKSINSKGGFRAVTVGECLDDPKENWYRHMNGSLDPAPPPLPNATSNKLSESPSTRPASSNIQLAETSFTASPSGTKSIDQIALTTQSAIPTTKSAEASSASQTHLAIATKSPTPSPSNTISSSSTTTIKANSAKSSSPARAQLANRMPFFVSIFGGIILSCVARTM